MKCFYHPQSDAVGICKNCHKGLCRECANDVGDGIACKDNCEAKVKTINELVFASKSTYKMARGAHFKQAILSVLFAFIFLGFSLTYEDSYIRYLFIILGIVALIGGIFSYLTSKKYTNLYK